MRAATTLYRTASVLTNGRNSFFIFSTHRSLARFFNSAKVRPAKRPSLVAVEFELLGVVGAASLECGEPAAEAGELIRRQLGNRFGDFFDFHAAQYSTA